MVARKGELINQLGWNSFQKQLLFCFWTKSRISYSVGV